MQKSCPRCEGLLVSKETEGVHCLLCHSCQGFYFSSAALKKKDVEAAKSVKRAESTKNECLRCPMDGTQMISKIILGKSARGQVVIDICPTCMGYWFDHGELRTLEELYRSHLASPDSSERKRSGEKKAASGSSDSAESRMAARRDTGDDVGWGVFVAFEIVAEFLFEFIFDSV